MRNELYHSDTYLGKEYSDGLKHFKYVSKEKLPNGKYRYYYYHKTGFNTAAIYAKTEGKKNSKYGTYIHGDDRNRDIHTVKKSNKLFSSKKTSKFDGGTHTTHEVGKIRQTVDSAAKKVKKTTKKTKKKLSKFGRKLKKLFS